MGHLHECNIYKRMMMADTITMMKSYPEKGVVILTRTNNS